MRSEGGPPLGGRPGGSSGLGAVGGFLDHGPGVPLRGSGLSEWVALPPFYQLLLRRRGTYWSGFLSSVCGQGGVTSPALERGKLLIWKVLP